MNERSNKGETKVDTNEFNDTLRQAMNDWDAATEEQRQEALQIAANRAAQVSL